VNITRAISTFDDEATTLSLKVTSQLLSENLIHTLAKTTKLTWQIIPNVMEEHTASISLNCWNLKMEAACQSERSER
jgi:hypothetical protein